MTDQRVLAALRTQRIETPSWGYGNSGTRFKVFAQEGVPRTPQEKIDDAAAVHRFTGITPTVALHMGIDPYPVTAYLRSGYPEKIRTERVGGQAAGWGA